ncbi:hypothetical protein SNOG_16295 [Parastagonospora nodorum SN15]|uniref:Uncharacterized protein n=1 Tax=Phaeosphaeria nodorum (strain SN15 / ATCC MYA-4574 / FGSC 10173) TaxID=321614 RepID=Q0TVX4_PHANO|nr:hypothetical protein SNOG_16295 [Parastagonospora nodorum SN15]EAT76281.1 hypothetical protein SNOG_16295 [Parastagonospora nodorum SN15]
MAGLVLYDGANAKKSRPDAPGVGFEYLASDL